MIKYLNLLVEYICKECDLKFTTKDGMDLHKSVFHKKESKPKKAKKLVATDYGYPDKTGRYFGNDPRKKYYPWYKKNSIFIKVLFIFFKLRRVVLLIFRNEWKLIISALKRSLFK